MNAEPYGPALLGTAVVTAGLLTAHVLAGP